MTKITGFATEKVYTRDIIAQTRQEREQQKEFAGRADHEALFRQAFAAFQQVYSGRQENAAVMHRERELAEERRYYLQSRQR